MYSTFITNDPVSILIKYSDDKIKLILGMDSFLRNKIYVQDVY